MLSPTMSTYHAGLTLPPRHPAGDDRTSCRVPRAPCVTQPTQLGQSMSMNTEGVRSIATSSIDIQDSFQRQYSSRAVQNSKQITTNVKVEEDEDDNIIKSNGKATIDRNFFKSMAKMIKAKRSELEMKPTNTLDFLDSITE